MSEPQALSAPRPVVAAAALVVVVAGLKAAASVFVPVLLGFFLAVPALPVLAWLRRRGVPGWLAIPLILLGLALLVFGFGAFVATSLDRITELAPAYQARLEELAQPLIERARQEGLEVDKLFNVDRLFGLFSGLVGGLATLLSEGVLVLLITVFILVEALGFPRKLGAAVASERVHARLGRAYREIQHYLLLKTVVSAATGLFVGVWLWIQGVDLPLFWGVTAGLLNYIPNLGAFISAIPPVLLALVQIGPWGAVGAAAAYLTAHFIIGNLVEPQLMGHQLGLSPLTVLLSLLFWGFVWGIVGALLAVPLTMVIKIVLENSPRLAWLGKLMEHAPKAPVLPPAESPAP